MTSLLLRTVLLMVVLIHATSASKILIVAPAPSISHQLPFHTLTKVLLERGHEITFFTTDPLKISNKNLTQVDMSVAYKQAREINFAGMAAMSPMQTLKLMLRGRYRFITAELSDPGVQDFIRKSHTFDLVINERQNYQAFYGLFHKVGSPPLVGVVTYSAFAPAYYYHGNAMNPAYMPDIWLGFSDHMTFWQRLYNTVFYLYTYYLWTYEVLPQQEALMREHFGPEPPSVFETERNFSLFIINNHFSTEYPRPHLPNVVETTGIHVSEEVEPLPKKLQEFLDGAEHGVVYMSLGSNVRSNALPPEKIQAFVEAFRQLPQRVLWKWESDSLPNQPENLMVSKWLPQQAVLAHPKVRLFITQGGLQSMNEATYHAVPFLVIPFFADQPHTAAKVVQAEIGLRLELRDITKDTVLSSIRTVVEDPKYKDNMKKLSAVFREHRADSVDRAVWWIEYVIRHNGAPHMRTAALDLYWWQLLLLDVIGFLLAAAAVTVCAVYFTIRRLVSLLKGSKQKQKQKKQ